MPTKHAIWTVGEKSSALTLLGAFRLGKVGRIDRCGIRRIVLAAWDPLAL